uniref:RB118 n=1 Tax=Ruegeria sp. PR1b TaxID=185588 RepID=Q8KWC4_9RHOB|nr:glycosyltransferase [Ruegeria sp. PR1b]AAN05139.1 RB118 [Ruegeria sp. PR1b]
MKIAFVVTAYNIEAYIRACLMRLGEVLEAGDQVIVVDDGSSDDTPLEIQAALTALTGQLGPEVTLTPIYLGANSHGGVGIPANIGLREALAGGRDALFFVDGDDLISPAGLRELRQSFAKTCPDLLIANYQVLVEPEGHVGPPPDAELWAQAARLETPEEHRGIALRMVGVPWRKLYRMEFMRLQALRFPEGDFFYEDNPFHWQACLAAEEIQFLDRVVCLHRIGRAGQTMAARGMELAVFFDHYERIVAGLKTRRYRSEALRWLLENMAWHVDQLSPDVYWTYAERARQTLAAVPRVDWQRVQGDPVAERARGMALTLAQGQLAAVIAGWQGRAVSRQVAALEAQLAALADAQAGLTDQVTQVRDWSEGQRALQEFSVLQQHGPSARARCDETPPRD